MLHKMLIIWTEVVWIIGMFLSSAWTLILTAPIHCRASIAEQMMEFLQICSNDETNSSIYCMGWGWEQFKHIFIFGWTISLTNDAHIYTSVMPTRSETWQSMVDTIFPTQQLCVTLVFFGKGVAQINIHHLFTLMLFQTYMTFSLPWNRKKRFSSEYHVTYEKQ